MSLRQLLIEKRDTLVDKWRKGIVEAYHADSHEFLLSENDRFSNPVGFVIREETVVLVGQIIDGLDESTAASSLEKLVRIRAVQELSPSEATGFVFMLKPIIKELAEQAREGGVEPDELHEIDAVVDRLALMAFDCYSACRDRISQIKVNDARRQTVKLIERLNRERMKGAGGNITDREI